MTMIVRKLRLRNGWSQDQLAELTGLSVRTIQRLEQGQTPSLESGKALASVFEVELSTFIAEEPDMNSPIESQPQPLEDKTTETIEADEEQALKYARGVKEFIEGVLTFVIIMVVFFAVFGFSEPILYWIFLGIGVGLIVQGLFGFEVFRFTPPNIERWLVEKELGRKL